MAALLSLARSCSLTGRSPCGAAPSRLESLAVAGHEARAPVRGLQSPDDTAAARGRSHSLGATLCCIWIIWQLASTHVGQIEKEFKSVPFPFAVLCYSSRIC
ncbi:hypothetical protein BRADI_1g36601v3 [Brachypodium distachyon]|uniref:Uncharacterized protein n=1 Tax=Brachypodium distachyon TaxID=15368 RepID=A0A0Q3H5N7_BRADI|nr:hypothetical protein BRADI_1g36601v3 [Brachypodium distachyon]